MSRIPRRSAHWLLILILSILSAITLVGEKGTGALTMTHASFDKQKWDLSGQVAVGNDRIVFDGEGLALFKGVEALENVEVEAAIRLDEYPAGQGQSPDLEFRLPDAIETDKVRFVCTDKTVHVTEIRLYEPGMPEYPSLLSDEESHIDVPNLALNAKVTASSAYPGRPPEGAVDGSIAFNSRWYGDGVLPHILTIDLGKIQSIGCIQILTGWPNGYEWTAIARDFEFQYWTGTEWQPFPGVSLEEHPGSVGLVVRYGDEGGLALIHRNSRENWLLGRLDAKGEFHAEKELALPHRLKVGETRYFKAVALGSNIFFYLGGRPVVTWTGVPSGAGSVGVWSASSGNHLALSDLRVTPFETKTCALLASVRAEADGKPIGVDFDPRETPLSIQIPSADVKQVRLVLEPTLEGQQIRIDGEKGREITLDVSDRRVRNPRVEVTAPDGKTVLAYDLSILPTPPGPDFALAFEDNFEGDAVNMDDWFYRTGMRWESESVPEAISVSDGMMRIRLDEVDGKQKVGGIISNHLWGYGYYETRAKLWKGRGWHASFWNMGLGPNQINEIDCFESVAPDGFASTLHWHQPRHRQQPVASPKTNVADEFHTYGWEWTPTVVRFFLDGEMTAESNYPGPHGLQNVWLTCVAHPNATTDDLPGEILYDYFRYYTKDYGVKAPEEGIIVDCTGEGYSESGTWEKDVVPVSHRYDRNTRVSASPGSRATWTPDLGREGRFDVLVWNPYIWPDGIVAEYVYEVCHAEGTERVYVHPILEGQKWVRLGTFSFVKGKTGSVSLLVENDRPARADGALFVPVEGGGRGER
ncbi:family 16 glycosylhydrolase [bacterium]|nr:family 16 glycosylhydrolase [bacterium]